MTFGARLIGSESVPRGAQVEIIRVVGGTAVVRPVDVER
jgi:membrane protein implicated in regulation of membrane protease activity